jgi:hypothetical protein
MSASRQEGVIIWVRLTNEQRYTTRRCMRNQIAALGGGKGREPAPDAQPRDGLRTLPPCALPLSSAAFVCKLWCSCHNVR